MSWHDRRLGRAGASLGRRARRHAAACLLAALTLALPQSAWDAARLRLLGRLEGLLGSATAATTPDRCPRCTALEAALRLSEERRQVALEALGEAVALHEAMAGVEPASILPVSILGGRAAVGLALSGSLTRGFRVRLDRGEADRVRTGEPVVYAGALVGRVVAVAAHTSELLLLTSPRLRVRARAVRPAQGGATKQAPTPSASQPIEGVARGDGAKGVRFLADGASPDLRRGDAVVVAWGSRFAPEGALIGTVTELEVDARSGSTEALVRPATELGTLDHVAIVRALGLATEPSLRTGHGPPDTGGGR